MLLNTIYNYLVYHIFLLQKATKNPYLRQLVLPPVPVIVNNKKEFIVKEILHARLLIRGKKLKYLVKCLEYADSNWQDAGVVNKL